MKGYVGEDLDVICQHCHDGQIIPIRIRVKEDGEEYVYSIKEYRQISVDGAYTTPDGIYVTSNYVIYECKVVVFGQMKPIRLYFNKSNIEWSVRA